MGTFRSVFLACLLLGSASFAQVANPNAPAPAPGTPADTNALPPFPVIPPATDTLPPATDVGQPASTNAAPVKRKKPATATPKLATTRGTLASVDKVAMTVTLDVKGKEQTFKVTSKTRVFADGKPAILADAKVGENVVAEYQTAKDKSKEALNLRFGQATAGPAKKASGKGKKPAQVDEITPLPEPGSEKPATPPATVPGVPIPAPGPGIPNPVPPAGTP